MPVTVVKLPVPGFAQRVGFYCGPACAQMVLAFKGASHTQDDLWAAITSKTNATRPPAAPPTLGHFPNQQCYHCGVWHCWQTLPEPLAETMDALLSSTVSFIARYPPTIDETTLALIDSLDAPISTPPFATLYAINHWVVITGYLAGDESIPGFPPRPVGKVALNAVYLNNPNVLADADAITVLSTRDFRQRLGLISCGDHLDRYPIVVATNWFGWLRAIWWSLWWRLIVRVRSVSDATR